MVKIQPRGPQVLEEYARAAKSIRNLARIIHIKEGTLAKYINRTRVPVYKYREIMFRSLKIPHNSWD